MSSKEDKKEQDALSEVNSSREKEVEVEAS